MALVRIRDEFPILERRNYLNSCSLGALSRRAEAALHEFAARWHDQGAAAWYEHWWSLLADLRRRVEKMFAAPAGSVSSSPPGPSKTRGRCPESPGRQGLGASWTATRAQARSR